MIVTAVEPKGDKAALLIMDNGQRVWTPEIEKAKPLIGKPIPPDWTGKQGEYGPQAFPPRDKRSAPPAAFRNTKEGQAIEQERMDRRTALMQAVAAWPPPMQEMPASLTGVQNPLDLADRYYAWLRKTPTATQPVREKTDRDEGTAVVQGGGGSTSVPASEQSRASEPHRQGAGAGTTSESHDAGEARSGSDHAGGGTGNTDAAGPTSCKHEHTSPLSPSGRELKDGKLRCLSCGMVLQP